MRDFWSVHADRLQLLTPGIGDCSFAAVGKHDRRAVSGMQREQFLTRRHLRYIGLRKQCLNVFGSDRLNISNAAVAELSQRFRRHFELVFTTVHIVHGARLLSYSVESFPRQSDCLIDIDLTTRCGSRRTKSIDNSPFFRSAPDTSIPSANTNVR